MFGFFNEFNKSATVELRPDLVPESLDAWAETKNLIDPYLDILVIVAIFPMIFKLREIFQYKNVDNLTACVLICYN